MVRQRRKSNKIQRQYLQHINMQHQFNEVVEYIRQLFGKAEGFIPLHEPRFVGNEKKYVVAVKINGYS